MKDIEIIKQLYNGNHLEDKELNKARHILHGLNLSLKDRLKQRGLRGWENERRNKRNI